MNIDNNRFIDNQNNLVLGKILSRINVYNTVIKSIYGESAYIECSNITDYRYVTIILKTAGTKRIGLTTIDLWKLHLDINLSFFR